MRVAAEGHVTGDVDDDVAGVHGLVEPVRQPCLLAAIGIPSGNQEDVSTKRLTEACIAALSSPNTLGDYSSLGILGMPSRQRR